MENFIVLIIRYYLIAFGVVLGGSFFGGLSAFITRQPPIQTMLNLSESLKIWGLVVALGGTFDSFRAFESGLFEGNSITIIKQIVYIISALIGAYTGTLFVHWIVRGDIN
ncbi:MAG: YtrH family sporulation protein [Vulcanibacillus sp.]